jgi:hypothetical protein
MQIVRSDNAWFNDEAVRYVRAAVFQPGCYSGHAVRVLITLPVTFRLKEG